MARPKGQPKLGGRQKGTENKITQEAKELFVSIMEGEVLHVQKALEDVRNTDAATYLKVLTNLFPYFIPKKTDVTTNGKEITLSENKPFHEWAEDDKTE